MKVTYILLCALALANLRAPAGETSDPGLDARKKILRERFLDHFNIGVQAPTEWIKETREKNGCQWDCSVAYLSGGFGEKQYWLNYGNTPQKLVASAKDAGVVPWFTFYALAASVPARYKPGPAQATPVNARVPETMKGYFELFKTLMEGAGKEAPWPVMVQIEPDEWCHLLLSANPRMDPEKVDVKVGSCGMEELKDLPDNLYGYAAALRRLRDTYAPNNVLLGCNPSGWDAQGSMSGQKMGELFKKVCVGYDFAVFETADRNKGMMGKQPPYGEDINVTGNLTNHLKWIEEFHNASGFYVFVWQVAAGNTYFATCNNTPGHFCDNLVQMILEDYPSNPNIGRYVKAGCIGWMLHGGQGGDTMVYDGLKDGITNPDPIPGNKGVKSEYADDDGGFMRIMGGNYYKQPYKILGPPAPAAAKKETPKPAVVMAAPVLPKLDEAALAAYDAKLRAKLGESIKAGHKVNAFIRVFGAKDTPKQYPVLATDEKNVQVGVQGNKMPVKWDGLSLSDRAMIAKALAERDEGDAAAQVLAGVYLAADGQTEKAEEFFGKAAAKAGDDVAAARKALGMK
ncbi:MAG: hypothetical protein KIS92_16495 [Planctomycetota bacterium]|nr:hypothetical protein [Planctomycetota bacterium]